MPGPYDWNVNTPPATQTRRQGDDHLRLIKGEFKEAMQDGPMANYPTDSHCTPGWARPFVFATLVALQGETPASPYGRLGIVTGDGNNAGLWIEEATGWKKVSGA